MQIMSASRKYPDEFRQRAVRMVLDARQHVDDDPEAIKRVADELSVPSKTPAAVDYLSPQAGSVAGERRCRI
jgi:transposase-like protein